MRWRTSTDRLYEQSEDRPWRPGQIRFAVPGNARYLFNPMRRVLCPLQLPLPHRKLYTPSRRSAAKSAISLRMTLALLPLLKSTLLFNRLIHHLGGELLSTQETSLKEIADAIREKNGSTGLKRALDFAERIRDIQAGAKDNADYHISMLNEFDDTLTTYLGALHSHK